MTEPFDPELLDAYLDGEVTEAERHAVEALVAVDPEAAAELEAVRAVRGMVRDLPPVDPPFGFFERMLRDAERGRPRRSRRAVVASIAAVAAAWVLVLSVGSGLAVLDDVPAIGEYADRHAEAVEAMPGAAPSERYAPMPMDETVGLGPDTDGTAMAMMGAYRGDDEVQLVYADGPRMISVFLQDRRADLDDLDDGELMAMDGGPAWHGVVDDMDVLVAVRGDATFTVVGDVAAMDAMIEIVDHLPSRSQSWPDRTRDAARNLLETFGLR